MIKRRNLDLDFWMRREEFERKLSLFFIYSVLLFPLFYIYQVFLYIFCVFPLYHANDRRKMLKKLGPSSARKTQPQARFLISVFHLFSQRFDLPKHPQG